MKDSPPRRFRRVQKANRWRDLSSRVRRRLLEEIDDLQAEEERVQGLLRLVVRPRLSLIDEETGSLVTATDREAIESERRS